MKVLQDVWILHKSGIVVFHRPFKESVAPQLFGAMMSALNTFSEQLTDGGLSNFELNNKRFTIIKRSNLLFVANSSKQFNLKKVNRELEKISKKFIKLHSKDLENYQGRIGAYAQFKEKIEDALEEHTDQE
ncbi:MAG: hypothetical protein KGD65_10910 [Candidatus Lokiarchaeota archaeon]|nr:hypothetical protein [Candidatus Lokiarchaeota archaeon]